MTTFGPKRSQSQKNYIKSKTSSSQLAKNHKKQNRTSDNRKRSQTLPPTKTNFQESPTKIMGLRPQSTHSHENQTHRTLTRMALRRYHRTTSWTRPIWEPIPRLSKRKNSMVSKSTNSQLTPQKINIQNGNTRRSKKDPQTIRLHHLNRHQTSISTNSHKQKTQIKNVFHSSQQKLALQNHALRDIFSTFHLDKSLSTIHQPPQEDANQDNILHGRILSNWLDLHRMLREHQNSSNHLGSSWHHTKFRKINIHSNTKVKIPWYAHRHEKEPPNPPKRKIEKHLQISSKDTIQIKSKQTSSSQSKRQTHSSLPSYSHTQEETAIDPRRLEDKLQTRLGRQDIPLYTIHQRFEMDKQGEELDQTQLNDPHSRTPNSHTDSRRLTFRLGRHTGDPSIRPFRTEFSLRNTGILDKDRSVSDFQLERNESDIPCIPFLQEMDQTREPSPYQIRLDNSLILPETSRRRDPHPQRSDRSTHQIIHQSPHQNNFISYPRHPEFTGRQTVENETRQTQLVYPQRRVRQDHRDIPVSSHDRSICRSFEHESEKIYLETIRPRLIQLQRLEDASNQIRQLCMPSIPSRQEIPLQSLQVPSSIQNSADSPEMERCHLVASASRTSDIEHNRSGKSLPRPLGTPPNERSDIPEAHRLPDWKELSEFIDSSCTPKRKTTRIRLFQKYKQFLIEKNLTDNHFAVLAFLKLTFETTPSQVQSTISAIDHVRTLAGESRYQDLLIVQKFMKAVHKKLSDRDKAYLNDPDDGYDPRPILVNAMKLPSSNLSNLRLKAIIILRVIPLLRSGDVASIKRSSIRLVKDLTGRTLLIFKYKGKRAQILNLRSESNYIEYNPAPESPANIILKLKERVDAISGSFHDYLIPDLRNKKKSLSSQRIANLTHEFMTAQRIPKEFTAHSLRTMTSEILSLLGVPDSDIDKRGGWSSKTPSSKVRKESYRSRVVSPDFSKILLNSEKIVIKIPTSLITNPLQTTA